MVFRRGWCCSRARPAGGRQAPPSSAPASIDPPTIEDPPRRKYNAVLLPLNGGEVEQTSDAAVFINSPTRQRRRRGPRSQRRFASAPPVSGRRCARPSLNGVEARSRRCASNDAAERRLPARLFARPKEEEEPEEPEEPENTEGSSSTSEDDDDDASELGEETMLRNGVEQRANEQVMVAKLKQLARNQALRYGSSQGRGSPRRRRQQVCAGAADFTAMYGRTKEILAQNMTLEAPRRRHTVTVPDLKVYSTPTADGGSPVSFGAS